MSKSIDLFKTGVAAFDAARAQSRVEQAASHARIARLKYAAELERVGRIDEAQAVIAEVRAEQERELA